jgi:hypothetical protein
MHPEVSSAMIVVGLAFITLWLWEGVHAVLQWWLRSRK